MARKPARMYRRLERPYVRREYMRGVPGSKIRIFDMGNPKGDFAVCVSLVAEEACQIRHSALEAARISANKLLMKRVGRNNFYMKIRVFPHHVLREHKLAVGAGADRISSGMRRAFGRPVGTAARVKAGQRIMSVSVNPENYEFAKEALKRASYKLPTPCRIVVEKGAELVS
ncbi:MAG: 50S ribosomal protein L16 [Candidatus Methanospirare jalkutatii]|nr:50S ribosomal protein L16 [Methanophagales archaeon]MCW3131694.1 50S ribosomal protein L16 [Candidatus Methanospirare jalkutatii]MCU4139390.1 Ribosomal protein L16/L10AE [Methanophagales archaeon]MCW7075598.1 50S ribosomal protein L16 [Candidatus Methanospirare jalkutatii]MCW7079661.1 50S ribosomal protein L16 [Candidatus Methanospirare jalkutatii]